jgi:hypothetical protein
MCVGLWVGTPCRIVDVGVSAFCIGRLFVTMCRVRITDPVYCCGFSSVCTPPFRSLYSVSFLVRCLRFLMLFLGTMYEVEVICL